MTCTVFRRLGIILTSFVALTAIGGGVAMLTGADRFPLEWLHGTPFDSYTVPALLLTFVVGGSSLAALILALLRSKYFPGALRVAGILLSGFILVEVLILAQDPPGPTPIELVYGGTGIVMILLNRFRRSDESPEA